MISILIPTYNYKVDELVMVLYKQSEQLSIDFEIIVYDDGSTTIFLENEAINNLKHARYKRFEENQGRGAIRNKLAIDASADVLLFLDADVLPMNDDFLRNYVQLLNTKFDVICGGIAYKVDPEPSQILRYVYGKKREAKDTKTRKKDPYIIVTANMLIDKTCFLSINTELNNHYGEDLLLSQNLMNKKATVIHIDNPVWHLGLENSVDYITKSKEALYSMTRWEKEGRLEDNFTSLQRTYKKLRKVGLVPVFRLFMNLCISIFVTSNLTSGNPSLFWFDLYRLHYYAQQKKHA